MFLKNKFNLQFNQIFDYNFKTIDKIFKHKYIIYIT